MRRLLPVKQEGLRLNNRNWISEQKIGWGETFSGQLVQKLVSLGKISDGRNVIYAVGAVQVKSNLLHFLRKGENESHPKTWAQQEFVCHSDTTTSQQLIR